MHHNDSGAAVQMVDVRARSVLSGPRSTYPSFPIFFAVGGDSLFSLDSGCFELVREQSDALPLDRSDDESDYESRFVCNSDGKWLWRLLPSPPFGEPDITSHAMHSDGHTILVSAKSDEDNTEATFIFDTGNRFAAWECLGEWTLPFTDRGHFDGDLEALVGLSKDPEAADPEAFGYLYAAKCLAPATDGALPLLDAHPSS